MLRSISSYLLIAVLSGAPCLWLGWKARAHTAPLMDAKACADIVTTSVIDTLQFWK